MYNVSKSFSLRLGAYLNMNTVVSLVYRSGNIRVCTFFSLFRMIEPVSNAVIVNESSVSFNAIVGLSGLMVYIVQYIIGRPANEQSFSSEQALCKLTAPPMIVNMRKIRIKFFIVSLLNVNQIFFSI